MASGSSWTDKAVCPVILSLVYIILFLLDWLFLAAGGSVGRFLVTLHWQKAPQTCLFNT